MTTPHLISAALAAGLATLFTLPIRADEPPEKAQPVVTVDVGVVTAVPVMVAGAQAIIEGPFGLQLRGELGWLGTPYVEAIDAFLLGVGAYGSGPTADATSDLIRAGIQDSLTARIAVGIRPFPTRGFEAYVGYTLNALGGHLGGKESVEAVTDKTFPSDYNALNVNIDSTLESVHAGVGWRWVVADRLVLGTSLEYLQTIASKTRLYLNGPRSTRELPELSAATNTFLDDVYTTWVKAPVLSASAAYRF